MMDTLSSPVNVVSMPERRDAVDQRDYLVRSRQDMLRLLDEMQERQLPLTISFLNVGCVLTSSLIYIDEGSDTLLMACPADWETALSEGRDTIMIGCVFEDSKIEFQCGPHVIVDLDGTPVVGLPIPEFMWRFQRRRDPRYRVSGLEMTLNFGFLEAEAEITDLSLGGIGMLSCNDEIKLEVGEVLRNCSIALPGIGQIAVDLQVQRQTKIVGADGQPMTQAGCQFTGLADDTRQMLTHFLDALSGK
jgi:c-di-GMP-binding flagellar brake protein YcgR